jgi:hypothetical protein
MSTARSEWRRRKLLVQRRTILWGALWAGGTAMTAVIAMQGAAGSVLDPPVARRHGRVGLGGMVRPLARRFRRRRCVEIGVCEPMGAGSKPCADFCLDRLAVDRAKEAARLKALCALA